MSKGGKFVGGGVEVGTAFVSVVPNADGFGRALKALVVPEAEQAGLLSGNGWLSKFNPINIAGKIGSGLKGALSSVAQGVGQQAGQLMAKAITGGFERLRSIDAASAKLRGLGMDAETSSQVMANALSSVKGTAFGMGEAAVTAAAAVAAGIKPGADLERVLKGVANAAAATDSSMADMGAIFNKVATTKKATNESLLQLADRGLPIYQKLAEQLGVTTSDVEKMASKGQIDFEQFAAAATAAAGTVASEMGGTATGSISNFGAALSRFGAAALGGIFEGIGPAFQNFTAWVDQATESVKPFAKEFGANLLAKGQQTIDWLQNTAIPAVQGLIDLIVHGDFGPKLREAFGWEEDSGIVTTILGIRDTVIEVVPQVVDWFTNQLVPAVEDAFGKLIDGAAWVIRNKDWLLPLVAGATGLVGALYGIGRAKAALDAIMEAGGWAKYIKSLNVVSNLTKVWTAVQTGLNVVMSANPIMLVVLAIAALVGGLILAYNKSETFRNFVNGMFEGIKNIALSVAEWFAGPFADFFANAWAKITGFFQGAWDWVTGTFGPLWDTISAILLLPLNLAKALISGAWDWITAKFSAVWTWVSGVFAGWWNTIKDTLSGPLTTAKNAIFGAWDWITGKFSDAWTFVKGWLADKWDSLTNLLRGPVDKAKEWIGSALDGIRNAFDTAVTFITDVWDNIMEAVKKPIRFVMVTVIDNGLIAGFNKIADFANSPRINPITPPGFASGGYVDLPWSASNRDPYLGLTPRGPIRFEGEEFIVNRQATRQHRGLLEAINSGRLPGYATGGFLGGLADATGNIASTVLDFLRDPKKALGNIIDNLLGGIANSPLLGLLVGIPRKLAAMVGEWIGSKLAPATGSVWAGGLPAAGVITSNWGFRHGPFSGAEHHDGIDIGAPMGTPVHSALPGVVTTAGWVGGYGNYVAVSSGAIRMFYAHLSAILAKVGQIVTAGQAIGLVGSTGWSTGPHLHWGASLNGASVNPLTVSRGYATGTASARRGLAWVGENGPELVNFRGGEQVYPNGRTPGDTYLFQPGAITIPLDDLAQLKTLEDFMRMLRVKTRMGAVNHG